MACRGEVEKEVVTSSIAHLRDTIERLLCEAKDAVKESVGQFIEKRIGKLFSLASAYHSCFQRLELQTKYELERLIQHYYRYSEVREVYEDLQTLEDEWDTVLRDVDGYLEQSGPQALAEGQVVGLEESFVDARSGKAVCLKDFLGSAAWSHESNCPQPSQGDISKPSSSSSTPPSDSTLSQDSAMSLTLVLLRHFA